MRMEVGLVRNEDTVSKNISVIVLSSWELHFYSRSLLQECLLRILCLPLPWISFVFICVPARLPDVRQRKREECEEGR